MAKKKSTESTAVDTTPANVVTVQRDVFVRALARANGIAQQRSAMPTLASALLRTEKGTLRVIATDLSLTSDVTISAAGEGSLDVCINARKALDAAKALDGDTVQLDASENKLTLRSGKRKFELVSHPASDYPDIPGTLGNEIEVRAAELCNAISRTIAAAATDESRPHMAGVMLCLTDRGTDTTATNGHMLAHHGPEALGASRLRVLVPSRAAHEFRAICEDLGTLSVVIRHDGRKVQLVTSGQTTTATLIDAAFPDWRQVVPKMPRTTTAVAEREALLSAIRAVSSVGGDATRGIELDVAATTIALASKNPDVGEASDNVGARTEGPPVRCVVSSRYVLAALASIPGEETVTLGFDGPLDPVTLTASDWLAVVMPMRG